MSGHGRSAVWGAAAGGGDLSLTRPTTRGLGGSALAGCRDLTGFRSENVVPVAAVSAAHDIWLGAGARSSPVDSTDTGI